MIQVSLERQPMAYAEEKLRELSGEAPTFGLVEHRPEDVIRRLG